MIIVCFFLWPNHAPQDRHFRSCTFLYAPPRASAQGFLRICLTMSKDHPAARWQTRADAGIFTLHGENLKIKSSWQVITYSWHTYSIIQHHTAHGFCDSSGGNGDITWVGFSWVRITVAETTWTIADKVSASTWRASCQKLLRFIGGSSWDTAEPAFCSH